MAYDSANAAAHDPTSPGATTNVGEAVLLTASLVGRVMVRLGLVGEH
jgi:hypothetical protein